MSESTEVLAGPPGRPGALMIAELEVHDEAGLAEYGVEAIPMLNRWGGEILAICPPNAQTVEDKPASRTLIIHSWPSIEHFQAFYDSAEYQPIKPMRLNSAESRLTLVATMPPGWLPRAPR